MHAYLKGAFRWRPKVPAPEGCRQNFCAKKQPVIQAHLQCLAKSFLGCNSCPWCLNGSGSTLAQEVTCSRCMILRCTQGSIIEDTPVHSTRMQAAICQVEPVDRSDHCSRQPNGLPAMAAILYVINHATIRILLLRLFFPWTFFPWTRFRQQSHKAFSLGDNNSLRIIV